MSECKHGNLWCNGTVQFRTTGPCLQCLRDLFEKRDRLREAIDELTQDRNRFLRERDEARNAMTPSEPKSKEVIAAETHMRDCPQCSKDPDARDGGLCEEGLRMLVEAVKAAKERRGGE